MSAMRSLILSMLAGAFIATSCSSSADDASPASTSPSTGAVEVGDAMAGDDPSATTSTSSTISEEPDEPVLLRRTARAGVDWDVAITSGRTVTVTFGGGSPGELTNPCAMDYQLRTREDAEEVGIAIDVTGRAEGIECTDEGYGWALTAELEKPLGDRRLMSRRNGSERETVQLETRLEPTWLPAGLALISDGDYFAQRTLRYGDHEDPQNSHLRVSITPIMVNPRLHGLRQLEGFEPITIRTEADGVVVEEGDGVVTVGFEEQGWYYRIHGLTGLDRDTLVEFAQRFERTTLIPEGSLPDTMTVPFFESEPLAGQG